MYFVTIVGDKSPLKVSNSLENSFSTEKSKANECSLSLGNNSKISALTQQSKSNECPVSKECDKSSSKVLQS